MLPHKHALISAAIGVAGWWYTRDPKVGAAAFAAGVLPDLDTASTTPTTACGIGTG